MGGYGALRYAIRHPGLLLGVASLSGFVHITGPGMASLLGLLALHEGMRPGLIWGSRRRCAENRAAKVLPGIHFWTTWRRKLTEFWPYALEVLEADR
jgi:S-formylglutathione hydrolase FrmB